jgi:transposase-like protein
MGTNRTRQPYPAELRERAVRMVREQQGDYASQWAAITSIAEKVGCNPETLRKQQLPADRLDPVHLAVIVDERDHGLDRRSSSAWVK